MIINFKLFENNQYNIGDCVLLDGSYFSDGNEQKAKIIEIEQKTSLRIWYDVAIIIDNTILNMTVSGDKVIIRKLIPKEIDEFDLKYNSLKYNL